MEAQGWPLLVDPPNFHRVQPRTKHDGTPAADAGLGGVLWLLAVGNRAGWLVVRSVRARFLRSVCMTLALCARAACQPAVAHVRATNARRCLSSARPLSRPRLARKRLDTAGDAMALKNLEETIVDRIQRALAKEIHRVSRHHRSPARCRSWWWTPSQLNPRPLGIRRAVGTRHV